MSDASSSSSSASASSHKDLPHSYAGNFTSRWAQHVQDYLIHSNLNSLTSKEIDQRLFIERDVSDTLAAETERHLGSWNKRVNDAVQALVEAQTSSLSAATRAQARSAIGVDLDEIHARFDIKTEDGRNSIIYEFFFEMHPQMRQAAFKLSHAGIRDVLRRYSQFQNLFGNKGPVLGRVTEGHKQMLKDEAIAERMSARVPQTAAEADADFQRI